jgi:hypothetical protein
MKKILNLPKTTIDKPYIEFQFDKNWEMKLCATSNWWGGIKHSFCTIHGSCGNTCLPKDLDRYIAAFKKKRIKEIKSEIINLQNKLKKIEDITL